MRRLGPLRQIRRRWERRVYPRSRNGRGIAIIVLVAILFTVGLVVGRGVGASAMGTVKEVTSDSLMKENVVARGERELIDDMVTLTSSNAPRGDARGGLRIALQILDEVCEDNHQPQQWCAKARLRTNLLMAELAKQLSDQELLEKSNRAAAQYCKQLGDSPCGAKTQTSNNQAKSQ